jgi:DNA replication protein DnaC
MDQQLMEAQQRLEEKRRTLAKSQPIKSIGESPSSRTTDGHKTLSYLEQLRLSSAVCSEHGYESPTYVWVGDYLHITSCPTCGEEWDEKLKREEAEREERDKVDRIQHRMNRLNIGKRFSGMTFEDYLPVNIEAEKIKATCQRYAETFPDRLKTGDGLIFIGSCGTGKNMLAAILCQEVVRQEKSAVHTTIFKLIRAIKDTWRQDSSKNEDAVINSFSDPDLLVIDEIGVQFGSETERLYLTEIINNRYESRKPTILISNLNLDELETVLGTRIIDRFYEGKSAILKFTWDSYRRRGPLDPR